MLKKKEVTSKQAFDYLREQINSEKPLSKFLSQQDIESGKVYTFVPEYVSEEQLYKFSTGGLYFSEKKLINGAWLSEIINESKPRIQQMIKDYLNAFQNNCCIFEECNSAPTDPWVITSKVEYVHMHDDMYYFFDKKNINPYMFQEAFDGSGGWYFLCVLSSLEVEKHANFAPFKEVSSRLLKTIANNATAFFVEAYDHEGYLMWIKS